MADVKSLLEAVIAEGSPTEAGYGAENLGRYAHTLTWMARGPGPPAGDVLDVGIFPGHLARALARLAGVRVRGVGRFIPPDFVRSMGAGGITIDEVDVERELLPYPSASFAGILATEVLEHLSNPGLLLTECWRVLAPGGRLYLSTPNAVDLRGRLRALGGRSPQSHLFGIDRPFHMNEWVHRREYAPHEVARMLRAAGFAAPAVHAWTPTRAEGGRGWVAWLAPFVNRIAGLGGTIFAAATKSATPPADPEASDRARIVLAGECLRMRPRETADVSVQLANLGTSRWGAGTGPGRVLVGAHLTRLDGRIVDRDFARSPLPRDVEPGESVVAVLRIGAPAEAGVFLVEVDLVRESERWFGDDASPTARLVLRVG